MTELEINLQRQVAEQAGQLARQEEAGRKAAISAGVATALSGYNLNPGAAEQLGRLLAPEVVVHKENDVLIVTGPGLKPIQDFVKERLASPEYAHFARNGSAPAGQTRTAGPVLPEPDASRETLGDRVIRAAVEARASQTARPAANLDMSQSFGFRR